MSWKRITLYIPGCDGCGMATWGGQDNAPTYETPLVARADLAERYEWSIVRTAEGIEMLCGDCTDARTCEAQGHDWTGDGIDTGIPELEPMPRHCQRCALPIPPDPVDGLITAADVAWLAEYRIQGQEGQA